MTFQPTGTYLKALLNAPLCAISRRWPRVIHAAPIDQISGAFVRGETIAAPCGARRLRLLGDDGVLVLWPPFAKCQPLSRCRKCWELTGRKRPRFAPLPVTTRRA